MPKSADRTTKDKVRPKERPIPFTWQMVQRILNPANPKIETRRLIKPQPEVVQGKYLYATKGGLAFKGELAKLSQFCRYGQPGDLLWVKEPCFVGEQGSVVYKAEQPELDLKWGNPRFMARRNARITLVIMDVRAERLLQITEEGAKREGFNSVAEFLNYWDELYRNNPEHKSSEDPCVFPINFRLWEVRSNG